MAQSSLYPPEHLTQRVLELACPAADLDLRDNCAFLVSQRRLTIDEAIEYANNEAAKDAAKAAAAAAGAATTTRPGARRISIASNSTPSTGASSAETPHPPPPRQRVLSSNADTATSAGFRKNISNGSARPAPRDTSRTAELPAVVPTMEDHPVTAGSRHSMSNGLSGQSGSDGDLFEASSAATSGVQQGSARKLYSAPHAPGAPASGPDGEGTGSNNASKVVAKTERRFAQRVAGTAPARSVPPPLTIPSSGPAGQNTAMAEGADADAEEANDVEPLLSALKQATPEERETFKEKQADMLYYEYGEETSMFDSSLARFGPGQVLFFMTSMTGERAVRLHCRRMENMLFLKLIPHHTIDVADSAFFQQRLRRLCANATGQQVTPSPPLLFVDKKLIGDFPTVQDLEDCGELDAKLLEAGCRVLRPRVVEAYGRRRAGLAAEPLVLPNSPSRATQDQERRQSGAGGGEVPGERRPSAPGNAGASPQLDANGGTARRVSPEEGEEVKQHGLMMQWPRVVPPPILRTSSGVRPPSFSAGSSTAGASQQRSAKSFATARGGAPPLPSLGLKDTAPQPSSSLSPPATSSTESDSARDCQAPPSSTPPAARNSHLRQPQPVYTVSPA